MKFLALLASLSTLLCCGLPALLVFLGFGAVLASIVSSFPFIVVLSQYKLLVFSGSAFLILVAWLVSGRAKSCPVNGSVNEDCQQLKTTSSFLLLISACLWILGFSVAFILPRFFI
jgi:mercuric ion transport protein